MVLIKNEEKRRDRKLAIKITFIIENLLEI
mgnify:CR=1 FL=1